MKLGWPSQSLSIPSMMWPYVEEMLISKGNSTIALWVLKYFQSNCIIGTLPPLF